ncbi:DTW domain-containing protein [Candidatus Kuenenia stuttgartensis]|uniref:DTW domain-containing protein n=1 Tax=Kuenenia stuttgartiensis TaxID=174633 RepID=UPI00146C247F|nr:tRNA-uridine aminocarboxypropyltransferase [Candidatus Kuenenia stuttgartiensis]
MMTKTPRERCFHCHLILQDCICPQNPPLWTEHKITLLTSRKESRIPSNTGRLIRIMLENTTAIFIGEYGWERAVEREIAGNDYTPVILFPMAPSIDGKNIIEKKGKPLNIFVPDTSWRNARRWLHKPLFLNLPKIGLREIPASEYHLRKTICQKLFMYISGSNLINEGTRNQGFWLSIFSNERKIQAMGKIAGKRKRINLHER